MKHIKYSKPVAIFGLALATILAVTTPNARAASVAEIGPSLVVVDKGMARSMSTTTLRKGAYAFAFEQKGLMAGLGLQGSKITQIHPD